MKVLALAGFLGLATDFDSLLTEISASLQSGASPLNASPVFQAVVSGQDSALVPEFDFSVEPPREISISFETLSLSTEAFPATDPSWAAWVRKTEVKILAERAAHPERLLVGFGYSLGGRLLLSLIAHNPDLFDAAIFLSTNPGLKTPTELAARLENDETWARRFETESWQSLITAWNSQGVFEKGSREPARSEQHYDRRQLARVLRDFSLARQPDFRSLICGWEKPQLWMAGSEDPKFVSYLQDLQSQVSKNKGTIEFSIVPFASHRIFLDQPHAVIDQAGEFISKLAVRESRRSPER